MVATIEIQRCCKEETIGNAQMEENFLRMRYKNKKTTFSPLVRDRARGFLF